MPFSGASGVDKTLAKVQDVPSKAAASVNVPPTSTPTCQHFFASVVGTGPFLRDEPSTDIFLDEAGVAQPGRAVSPAARVADSKDVAPSQSRPPLRRQRRAIQLDQRRHAGAPSEHPASGMQDAVAKD